MAFGGTVELLIVSDISKSGAMLLSKVAVQSKCTALQKQHGVRGVFVYRPTAFGHCSGCEPVGVVDFVEMVALVLVEKRSFARMTEAYMRARSCFR